MGNMKALAGIATIALIIAIGTTANAVGPTTVGLGTATSFAVLAGAGITNTGPTTITGDVGTFPTTTEIGFSSVTLNGVNHAGDAVTQGAKTDLTTAYLDAAGRSVTSTVPTELGGTTKTAGVYDSAAGTFGITGALTLDGQGDPTAVFIFKMASTLTTATSSSVVLIGSAQSCNIFWQVGSSATLGGSTTFRGNILALTSITLVTAATVDGRVLARNGAVTLDTNTITRSVCAGTPGATPTPPPAGGGGGGGAPAPAATPVPTSVPFGPITTAAPTATPVRTPAPTRSPAPAIVQLPATGTSGDPAIAAFGLMLAGLGAAVLLRRPRRPRVDS